MKKHIEVLERLRFEVAGAMNKDAIDAAIDLMNSVEFSDETAEREHCRRVAELLCDDALMESSSSITDKLMRERAAARAEGAQKRYEQLMIGLDVKDARLLALQAQLSAAQAEIERRIDWADRANAAETKLKAAQAKIERVKRQERFWGEAADLTQIKLSNLRTSAESYLNETTSQREFEDAIEASK